MTEAELRERYRRAVLDWAASQDNPKKANGIFKKHHAFYKEIRDLEVGRRAIESLLVDPETPVRLLAATHALPFAPAHSQQVLEALAQGEGSYALDARYTLMTFRQGRLNLDW